MSLDLPGIGKVSNIRNYKDCSDNCALGEVGGILNKPCWKACKSEFNPAELDFYGCASICSKNDTSAICQKCTNKINENDEYDFCIGECKLSRRPNCEEECNKYKPIEFMSNIEQNEYCNNMQKSIELTISNYSIIIIILLIVIIIVTMYSISSGIKKLI